MNQKEYNQTPMGKYIRQRSNANRRNIPWDFTFETWWKVWEDSGKWELRGKRPEDYCMSRIDDEGQYGPQNVEIKQQRDNRSEYLERRWKKEPVSDPFRRYERTNAWEYRKEEEKT